MHRDNITFTFRMQRNGIRNMLSNICCCGFWKLAEKLQVEARAFHLFCICTRTGYNLLSWRMACRSIIYGLFLDTVFFLLSLHTYHTAASLDYVCLSLSFYIFITFLSLSLSYRLYFFAQPAEMHGTYDS